MADSSTVTLTFAGDSAGAKKASKEASEAIESVGDSAGDTGDKLESSGKSSDGFLDKMGKLGAGITGVSSALDDASSGVQALADIQNFGRNKAQALARAQADVQQAMIDQKQAAVDLRQAQQDLTQSQNDGQQAALDENQALIDQGQAKNDAVAAQKAYNDAVKKSGADSLDAMNALTQMSQAQQDLNQAKLDYKQASDDAKQAQIDGTQAQLDGTQATRDGKDAQLDLNDAVMEANPSGIQKVAKAVETFTPLLSAMVGVMGLVTAAQWAWNAAQAASPTTWIIAGIIALIAVIVLIATKTTWFQTIWKKAWSGIKTAAEAVWNWLKKIPGWTADAFKSIAKAITAPYRSAFNLIADAWNNTIGRLSWSVPSWIPVIGGNTISVPHLPHFHSGGVVPGAPGSETLAVLQAGERVTTATSNAAGDGDMVHIVVNIGQDQLFDIIAKGVQRRGGKMSVLGLRAG